MERPPEAYLLWQTLYWPDCRAPWARPHDSSPLSQASTKQLKSIWSSQFVSHSYVSPLQCEFARCSSAERVRPGHAWFHQRTHGWTEDRDTANMCGVFEFAADAKSRGLSWKIDVCCRNPSR